MRGRAPSRPTGPAAARADAGGSSSTTPMPRPADPSGDPRPGRRGGGGRRVIEHLGQRRSARASVNRPVRQCQRPGSLLGRTRTLVTRVPAGSIASRLFECRCLQLSLIAVAVDPAAPQTAACRVRVLGPALLAGVRRSGRSPGGAVRRGERSMLTAGEELPGDGSACREAGRSLTQAGLSTVIEAACARRPGRGAVRRMAGDDGGRSRRAAGACPGGEALAQGAAGSAPAAAAIALATWDCWAALAALRTTDRLRTAGGAVADCERRHAEAMERLAGAPDAPPAGAEALSGKTPSPMRESR